LAGTKKYGIDTDDGDRETRDAVDEFVKAELAKDWNQEELKKKYDYLMAVTQKNFPNLAFTLEFALSVKTILNIKGHNLPFIGILLGPPSSLKTFIVGLFKQYENHVYYTDNFSPHAMVSHNSAFDKKKLKKVDMLPKFRNKLLLTPELSPTFSLRDDNLLEVLGMLIRIADGEGFGSDTGAQGHRGYEGEMMFTWLGAAVDIPYKVHKLLGYLGPKLYFFRLSHTYMTEDDYFNTRNENFPRKKKEVTDAFLDYTSYFDLNPAIILEEETEADRMIWNGHGKDDEDNEESVLPKIEMLPHLDDERAHRVIIKLALMLRHLRAVVPTFHTYSTQGAEYAYTLPVIEEPSRAITQMQTLARGRALSQGRTYITMNDIPMIVHTVLSTATLERVKLFELLIKKGGELKTNDICESLGTSPPTARRTMTELKAAGLVYTTTSEEEEAYHNVEMGIILRDEFKWFLGEEFAEIQTKLLKEKTSPRTHNKKEKTNE
jgi:DNA-binding transcriptional ArsR family regulator